MEDRFDPNDVAQPNYRQKLMEHYKNINKRLGVSPTFSLTESRVSKDIVNIVDTKPPKLPVIEIVEAMSKEEKQEIIEGKYFLKNPDKKIVSIKFMLPTICKAYNVDYKEVVGLSKTDKLVAIRAAIIQTIYIMYGPKIATFPKIGAAFNRDHTSIMNIVKKYNIDIGATKYMKPVKKPGKSRTGS